MENLTAKKYLESKGLNDHDYMDSGMINHISEMMEEYHKAKLLLLTRSVVNNQRKLLIDFFDVATEDDITECLNGFSGRTYDRLKTQFINDI